MADEEDEADKAEELGGLFHVSRPEKESRRAANALDCSKFVVESPQDWDAEEVCCPPFFFHHIRVFKTVRWPTHLVLFPTVFALALVSSGIKDSRKYGVETLKHQTGTNGL